MNTETDQLIEALRTQVEELHEEVREALKAREMLVSVRKSISHLIDGVEAIPEFTQLQPSGQSSPKVAEFRRALSAAKAVLTPSA